MRGPFPPIRHRKHRKYTEYSRCSPQKVRFLCRTRRKAQEYWLCIPSIFNEARREKILFAAIASLGCTPFLPGFIDFFTAGLFFLLYMPFGGPQAELDEILGRRTRRYAAAYLLGIPTLFVYTLVWMARIAEELRARAIELGVEGPYTSFRHMFDWNIFGILCFGPMIATKRFFDTRNKVEIELNRRADMTE